MCSIHLIKTNLLPPERDSYDSGNEGRAGVLDPSSSDPRGGYGAKDDVLTHEPSRYLAVCNLDWTAVRDMDILTILGFVVTALQHTEVKCTWEDGNDLERERAMKEAWDRALGVDGDDNSRR